MNTKSFSRRDVLKVLAALQIAATEADDALAASKPSADELGGKIVFENDKVRVIEHFSRPRMGVCGQQMHSHPPHLTIVLKGGKSKVTLPDKEPFIVEPKDGTVFWDPGGAHIVENIGRGEQKVYLVEIKAA